MLALQDTAVQQGKVIHIHAFAPVKPRPGQACNGCGVCCIAAPCPLGMLLSGRFRGACAALRWEPTPGRYRCGALSRPRQVLQQALPRWLRFLARPLSVPLTLWSRRWIAAGRGCDSSLQVVTDNVDNHPNRENPP